MRCICNTSRDAPCPRHDGNAVSCRTCGDTGDVHDLTGEWRGYCACRAGQERRGTDAEHDPHDSLTPGADSTDRAGVQEEEK